MNVKSMTQKNPKNLAENPLNIHVVEDVTVKLYNSSGTLIGSTLTNMNGYFLFDDACDEGEDYTVKFNKSGYYNYSTSFTCDGAESIDATLSQTRIYGYINVDSGPARIDFELRTPSGQILYDTSISNVSSEPKSFSIVGVADQNTKYVLEYQSSISGDSNIKTISFGEDDYYCGYLYLE